MRYYEFVKLLSEVSMKPTSLKRTASALNATVGMEFELCFPNVADVVPTSTEPDMTRNLNIANMDQIVDFFLANDTRTDSGEDGGYNSEEDCEKLKDKIFSDYVVYINDMWSETGKPFFHDYIKSVIDDNLLTKKAKQDLEKEEPDLTGEEAKKWIRERANNHLARFVNNEWNKEKESSFYEEAFDEWLSSEDLPTPVDYLNSFGIESMFDLYERYSGDIEWPYWTHESVKTAYETIADILKPAINRPVNWSADYHGAPRAPGTYSVERDGSIKVKHRDDAPTEIVSCALPLAEMEKDLDKIFKWAKDNGCYTNESTGLHINVSLPEFNRHKLDFVKLVLFLGDEYVLQTFSRLGNEFTNSSLGIIKQKIQVDPAAAYRMMDQMRQGLNTLASRTIHSGYTSKRTSANIKDEWIEFRSPGNNWLAMGPETIKNTIYRFITAMDIATDETKYKEEYAKKLYKLLYQESSDNMVDIFTRYNAGLIPSMAIKDVVKTAQQTRATPEKEIPAKRPLFRPPPNEIGLGDLSRFTLVDTSTGEMFDVIEHDENLAIMHLAQALQRSMFDFDVVKDVPL